MKTARLYLDDPHLFDFTAEVVAHVDLRGQTSLVLDRTAFYPEAGGQMADRGLLDDLPVIDVQADDAGVVHHIVEGNPPRIGAVIQGRIDARRRRQHMAQHSGQHALSAALTEIAGAPTVSSRLGEGACTIDVRRKTIPDELLARAEEAISDLIEANVQIRCFFPPPEELAQLPLRRRPKVDRDVRVVAIGDFDLVPCGGTHCRTTSQIGLLTILGAERYKGLTRVTFAAGARARRALKSHFVALQRLGRQLTCGALDVPGVVDRLRNDRDAARRALRETRGRLARRLAGKLLASPDSIVVAVLDEADAPLLHEIGSAIAAQPGRAAALAAPSDTGTAIFIARNDSADLNCGDLVREIAAVTKGRGGGRPSHGEGHLPPGIDWPTLVAAAMRKMRKMRKVG